MQALATVNEAIAIDPESIPALAWKQSVFLHMGKRDEAEAVNDRILEIDPKNEDALLYRAEVFRIKGKGELALGVYDAYLLHYPDRMGIWKVRAELLLELHRYPDALESVEKAISFDPEGKEWDMSGAGGDNGNECIRLSNGAQSNYIARTVVEYCYFNNTGAGDSEAVSLKCRENVIRYCTFTNNQDAMLVFRNGTTTSRTLISSSGRAASA